MARLDALGGRPTGPEHSAEASVLVLVAMTYRGVRAIIRDIRNEV